jgi:lipopolysaccharide export system protein LptA
MNTLLRWPWHSRSMQNALFAAIAAVTLGVFAMAPAHAQTMTNTFGGLSKNSGQPIDIESDVLVVHDAQKYATFKGNVKAVQGTTTLRSRELDVHYVGSGSDSLTKAPETTGSTTATGAEPGDAMPADAKAADAKPGDAEPGNAKAADAKPGDAKPAGAGFNGEGTQISKIEARGDVVITSDQDQTTTSDWALYDVPAQMVTVGGNVVLMQGKNVLKGDRLVIDLKTGESRFENKGDTGTGGRIRALFMPKDAKPGDDKSKDNKSGGDKSADKSGGKGAGTAAAAKPTPAAAPASESEPMPLLPAEQ